MSQATEESCSTQRRDMNDLPQDPKTNQATALPQAALGLILLALLLFGGRVAAQTVLEEIAFDGAEASVEPVEPLTADELAELVAPIALYPDDLLSIVLPASTYPLQIVQAARLLEARIEDESLEPSEHWDDSIIALLNYPEVLELMNSDLDWTWKLGEAVLIQQQELIAAVGDFRERARLAGNLESDSHQIVEVLDDGAIEIKLADPEVIYVPYYEPSRVTVYSPRPVYHYYPRAYPVYYYPYPAGYVFSSGFFWGVTSAFSIGWSTHHLHLHHYGYVDHPYYGHHYDDYHFYRRPIYRYYAGNYWYPHRHRYGASPRHRDRHRGDRHERDQDANATRRDPARDVERDSRHARLIARGTSRRTGVPRARMKRQETRADRPDSDDQLAARIGWSSDARTSSATRTFTRAKPRDGTATGRENRTGTRTAAIERARHPVKPKRQALTRNAAARQVQSTRNQPPRSQRAVRTAAVRQPRAQRPALQQAPTSSPAPRSQQAFAPKQSQPSAQRSTRATDSHDARVAPAKASRAQRSRTIGFRKNQ